MKNGIAKTGFIKKNEHLNFIGLGTDIGIFNAGFGKVNDNFIESIERNAEVNGNFDEINDDFVKVDGNFGKVSGDFGKVSVDFAKINDNFIKIN